MNSVHKDMNIRTSSYYEYQIWNVIRCMYKYYHVRVHVWASYQIRKIAGCACAGNAGNVFPRHRFQRKLLVSDPGMHHGTCVTHVPWCMSGSLTCGDGENVPGIPGACAPAISRIWQEAHWDVLHSNNHVHHVGHSNDKLTSLWGREIILYQDYADA